jgi:hypothetical protein
MKRRRFRVGLSFPGEKRAYVRAVAEHLARELGEERVLYDEYLIAELARPDLDLYLGGLFRQQADLIVPFYCAEYDRKKWCNLEWRQMRDILFNLEGERIMPFRFDDAPVKGELSIDGYAPIGSREPGAIAELILERLRNSQSKRAVTITRHNASRSLGSSTVLSLSTQSELATLSFMLRTEWGYNPIETYLQIGGSRRRTALVMEKGWASVRYQCPDDVWVRMRARQNRLENLINQHYPSILAKSSLLDLASMLSGTPAAEIVFSSRPLRERATVSSAVRLDWDLRNTLISSQCPWHAAADVVIVHIKDARAQLIPLRKRRRLRGRPVESFWRLLPERTLHDLVRAVYCETRGIQNGNVVVTSPEPDWSDAVEAVRRDKPPDAIGFGLRHKT